MQNSEIQIVRISDIEMYLEMLGLSDAKLKTDDGRTFDVHRVILAVNSDYFRAMFCGLDRDRTEFTVPGISGECLSNVLWYAYTGDVRVTEENVKELLIAADYLLLKDLQMHIKKSIKAGMTELNCLIFLVASYQTNHQDIFRECFRFIQTRFEGIMRRQKEKIADLPLEVLKQILGNCSLYVYNETTVWQAIVEWTEKDTSSRMCDAPQLILTLAMEDIGEELATEVLQHEIISNNSSMTDLIEMRSSKNFSNLDVLISYLRSYTSRFIEQSQPYKPFQSHNHRIPPNLYVFTSAFVREQDGDINKMYITYDENPDLWRKITDLDIYPDFLIAIGHNIYIFKLLIDTCINFDLSAMDWKTMEDFSNSYGSDFCCVLAIDAYIYILGTTWEEVDDDVVQNDTYAVEVYDTERRRWFAGVSLLSIFYGASVTVEKKIYFVGDTLLDGMTAQMFDPVTQQWSLLSPPTVNRTFFALVAYHQKIYLVGGSNRHEDFPFSNAEVFDPATNLWKALPDLPHTFLHTKAEVFRDQIVVYDGDILEGHKKNTVIWNSAMECWEVSDKTTNNFNPWSICSVDDVDTIRMITKQNRDPKTQMEKSFFI